MNRFRLLVGYYNLKQSYKLDAFLIEFEFVIFNSSIFYLYSEDHKKGFSLDRIFFVFTFNFGGSYFSSSILAKKTEFFEFEFSTLVLKCFNGYKSKR